MTCRYLKRCSKRSSRKSKVELMSDHCKPLTSNLTSQAHQSLAPQKTGQVLSPSKILFIMTYTIWAFAFDSTITICISYNFHFCLTGIIIFSSALWSVNPPKAKFHLSYSGVRKQSHTVLIWTVGRLWQSHCAVTRAESKLARSHLLLLWCFQVPHKYLPHLSVL